MSTALIVNDHDEIIDMPEVIFKVNSYEEAKDKLIARIERSGGAIPNLQLHIYAFNNFKDIWNCWVQTGLNSSVPFNGTPNFIYFLGWVGIIKFDMSSTEEAYFYSLSYTLFDNLSVRFAKHTHGLDDDLLDVLKI